MTIAPAEYPPTQLDMPQPGIQPLNLSLNGPRGTVYILRTEKSPGQETP